MERTEFIKVRLYDDSVVEAKRFSFIVQEWYNGKWNTLGVYDNTTEGFEQATTMMNNCKGDARIEQLF